MDAALLVAIFLLAIVLGILKPDNSRITALLFLTAWFLMCLNADNPDYAGYEARYYAFDQPWVADITPKGFLFLTEIGNNVGLNFFCFRLILCTVSLVMVFSTVVRFSLGPNIVLSVYLATSFFLDVIQFRFFFAAAIGFWSLRFLVDANTTKNNFMYAFCIMLAAAIHPVMLVYLLLYGIRFEKKRLRLISIVVSGLVLLLLYSGIAQALAPLLVGELRAERYFFALSKIGYIPYALIALIPIALNGWCWKNADIANSAQKSMGGIHFRNHRTEIICWSRFSLSASYCMLPVLCTLILRPEEFFRPIRLMLLIFIMPLTAVLINGIDLKNKRVGSSSLAFALLLWILVTFLFCYRSYFESVLAMIFMNNLLL